MKPFKCKCHWCEKPLIRRPQAKPVEFHFCDNKCKGEYQRTLKPVTKEWLIEHYINQKLSAQECAELYGCSEPTIFDYLRKFDIPRRSLSESHKEYFKHHLHPSIGRHHTDETKKKLSISHKKHYIPIDWLIEHYVNQKLSTVKLAKIWGCAQSTICTEMKRHNIPRRSNSESNTGELNWVYGIKGIKHPLYGRKRSEETKQKIKIGHFDIDYYWEHGHTRSNEEYPQEFKDIRKSIMIRDNYTCRECYDKLPKYWATHHINYDKNDNRADNLIFLCVHCHGKTNTNREFWQSYFENMMIGTHVDTIDKWI